MSLSRCVAAWLNCVTAGVGVAVGVALLLLHGKKIRVGRNLGITFCSLFLSTGICAEVSPAALRDTRGGDFLYRFHYELQMMPMLGRWIVGASALILLVALVSGIVTHRRIFSDFFTFRRDRSAPAMRSPRRPSTRVRAGHM